ncbi:MAG: hypothetical protein HRT67_02240 [Flavobacteriaceae bacterium]|nr:hypothetical protein [Flavobacteriaceae bacterium]
MKYLLWFLFIACIVSILLGYILDIKSAQKCIGFGVAGLFLVVFPLFSYYRWKDKDVNDYMLTKENLDKMRAYNDSKDKN